MKSLAVIHLDPAFFADFTGPTTTPTTDHVTIAAVSREAVNCARLKTARLRWWLHLMNVCQTSCAEQMR